MHEPAARRRRWSATRRAPGALVPALTDGMATPVAAAAGTLPGVCERFATKTGCPPSEPFPP